METQPPKYVSPPGTWKTKLALRAASLVCVIVLAGLGGSLATTPRVEMGTVVLVLLVPATIVTFAWDVAEGICILKRGGNRGMHPGAIVAIDLIAWMGWAIVVLFLATVGLITRPRYLIEDYSGYDDYRYRYDPSKVTPEDAKLEQEISGKGRAMVAFAVFTTISHFVLFVIACYETNVRNKMPRTIYVMQPVYGPSTVIPGGYSQLGPLPPHLQQGQPMPQNPMFTQPPHNQLPVQPPATQAAEPKWGAERFA